MNPNKKNKDQSLNNQLADYALFPEMNPGPVLRFDLKGNVLLANCLVKIYSLRENG